MEAGLQWQILQERRDSCKVLGCFHINTVPAHCTHLARFQNLVPCKSSPGTPGPDPFFFHQNNTSQVASFRLSPLFFANNNREIRPPLVTADFSSHSFSLTTSIRLPPFNPCRSRTPSAGHLRATHHSRSWRRPGPVPSIRHCLEHQFWQSTRQESRNLDRALKKVNTLPITVPTTVQRRLWS